MYGQRYSANGSAIGDEFLVNTYTEGFQQRPSITVLSDGGWVVTWESENQDGDGLGVYGQRYDSDGGLVGNEFQINSYTTNNQYISFLTGLSDGGWVVVWYSLNQDGSGAGIYSQRYDSDGVAIGGEFRVNTTTSGTQSDARIASLSDGGWIVAWETSGQDGSQFGIYAQRYAADGSAINSEFQVNSYTNDMQTDPSVMGLSDGGWVITWESSGQDGGGLGIYGQRYDVDGGLVGDEFRVNTYTIGDQSDPSAASLVDGGWVVIWQSSGQDGDGLGIYGQRYGADGNVIDGEFQVNTYTVGDQKNPSIIGLSDGGWVVSWDSFDQDGSGLGVFAQRYDADGNAIEVDAPNSKPTGEVTISGTATEDQILTASNTLADADGLGTLSYQWNRDGVAIDGATSETYTLVQADVGKTITATVSYTDGYGTEESVTSAATSAVTNVSHAVTGEVVITGTATEGQVLSADTSSLADEDGLGEFSYRWLRDGVEIGEQTDDQGNTGIPDSPGYSLIQADVGHTISVRVTYTDCEGTVETVTSAATAIVANVNDAPTGGVTISGTATEDQILTAFSTLADEDGLGALSYQWNRDGVAIDGATSETYTLSQVDVGSVITATVTYTDGYGYSETITSAATSAVANVNDAPTGGVTISGTATEDQILTASNTLADADGLGTLSYQWNRDGVAIDGATSETYTLVQADVGKTITATVSYTDGYGTEESVTSAATSAVTNVSHAVTGEVVITGTATEGQVLSADTSSLADEDGLGEFSYRWLRDGVEIGEQTDDQGNTGIPDSPGYSLIQADVGHTISVRVTYTDGEGTVETVTSAATAIVANVNDAPTGGVTISGTATEDQILTAVSTLADEDGLGALSYQWNRDGVAIDGATSETYTLSQVDVGSVITATVTYTDGYGYSETITSPATSAVANVNDAPTGGVTISGTATEDQILTASNTLADADGLGTLSYQWNRDGVAIDGATSETYTLVQADVGKTITATVSYTDGYGTEESVTSAATSAVTNVSHAVTGEVVITGTATEGQVLSADTSSLADEDGLGTLSYQWKADGVAIDGATSETYTLSQVDVGSVITATVTYTDGEGTVESVTSAATSAVTNVSHAPTGEVTITGTAAEDQVLSADTSLLTDADGLGTLSYQWKADGVAIDGATSETYTLSQVDVGKTITATVSYTDGEGTLETVTSAATSAVANVNDAPTGGVTISGTATEDQILTASNTLADADGLGTLSYQWNRDGVAIDGATSETYTLVQADVGKTITATVSYTDGYGTEESVTSAATSAVTNVSHAVTGEVVITGTATEGQVLSADTSSLADEDGLGTLSYQWNRDGVAIEGATSERYTLVQADVGKTITATVSYTDGEGTLESVVSAATSAVTNVSHAPTGEVIITGTATEGQVLSADPSLLTDADGLGTLSYQWTRAGSAIEGATDSTYTLTADDVGSTINVAVFYTDGEGTNEAVTASATALVQPAVPSPVVITGTVSAGNTVNIDTSNVVDPDGFGSFLRYKWYLDGEYLGEGRSETGDQSATEFTLTQADTGKVLTVEYAYVDGAGNEEIVLSDGYLIGGPKEFQVNTYTSGSQQFPKITALTDGGFVVTWASNGQDGSGHGIYGQRYTADGSASGSEFQVNTYTANSQAFPNITGLADGGFVVTWQSNGQDGSYNGIYGQRYDADGSPSGAEFQVNTYTNESQSNPSVTGLTDGGFVVTWISNAQDGSNLGIYGQLYRADGNRSGSEFQVNTYTNEAQTYPSVAALADGGFVVTWQSNGQDGSYNGIYGQRYDADGSPSGAEFQVNTYTYGAQTDPSITALADGGFVVTWFSIFQDGDGGSIYGQRYTANGNRSGSEFKVNTITNSYQEHSSVTALADGGFVVTWQSFASHASDGSEYNISGQRYTANGSRSGSEFQVNTHTPSSQTIPSVTGLADGGFVVTWHSRFQDGSDYGIYGQRYDADGNAIAIELYVPNTLPTGIVTIRGDATEDEALSVDTSLLSDADGLGTLSYQWNRDGVAIDGATSETYTLVQADVGKTITATVSYTDGYGTEESVTSAATSAVTNVSHAVTGEVVITGTATEGQVLSADTSSLADEDGLGEFSYRWLRDGVEIGEQTDDQGNTGIPDSPGYSLIQADVGHTISVRVTYTDGEGTVETVTSAATAIVANVNDAPTGGVTISGTATEDQILTAVSTLADEDGLGALSYQWNRDGVAIDGATSETYTLSQVDVGSFIKCLSPRRRAMATAKLSRVLLLLPSRM